MQSEAIAKSSRLLPDKLRMVSIPDVHSKGAACRTISLCSEKTNKRNATQQNGASEASSKHGQQFIAAALQHVSRLGAYLDNEGKAIAPKGQECIHLLLHGRVPFKVESQGHGCLLQLHI